ncbi:hypothetical protein QBZ16_001553 [Prototheca wickerhamii]|uniref:Uncharacterized protein n=1 Tax=Prototheca wickerhamii TaxID=3111 RepID=A0AAD9MGT6_PROWI|nr:hypothetical protein QBZ16_001553 [Prototheca wickerhamii]
MSPAQSGSEDPYLDDLKRILEFHKKSTAQLGKRTRSGDRAPEPDALGGKLIAQIKEYEELTSKPPGHTDKQRREVPSILRNSFPTKRGPRPSMLSSLSSGSGKGPRFNLLLLQDGEEYVDDFVAECDWPEEVPGNWSGRARLPGSLRLASCSVFFDPDDVRVPIVRLPFASVESLEAAGGSQIRLAATRSTRMKPGGADVPYAHDVRRAALTWRFTLSFAAMSDVMPVAQVLLAGSRLPHGERAAALAAVLEARAASLRFDPGHLRGSLASERVLHEARAWLVSPLARERAALALSSARLYAQPQHDPAGRNVRSAALASIACVARRRAALQDVGLEVFFLDDGWAAGQGSAFFVFASRDERERFLQALLAALEMGGEGETGGRGGDAATPVGSRSPSTRPSPDKVPPLLPQPSTFLIEPDSGALRRATQAWQRGELTNLDYLLFLNLIAGRSFADLTQYPVFPWVLRDYESEELDLDDRAAFRDLSRPVGALSPARLEAAWARYREMRGHLDEPPFLYGSHYSCPAYVLYWLVRAAPGHMLRLQNGRFDAPDRLFRSVAGAWRGVLEHPADVKELIPEFFLAPGAHGDFLTNKLGLGLGKRQNGEPVGDVELPPWARGSPARFLTLHRAALEAPYVSANLHHWIDLIFGAKQRGAGALRAGNLFRAVTYEGGADVAAAASPEEAALLRLQIEEYGQAPRQLFAEPHPRRRVAPGWEPWAREGADAGGGLSMARLGAICRGSVGQDDAGVGIVGGVLDATRTAAEHERLLDELDVNPGPLLEVDDVMDAAPAQSWAAMGRSWSRSLRSPKLDSLVSSAVQSRSGKAVRSLFDRRFSLSSGRDASVDEGESEIVTLADESEAAWWKTFDAAAMSAEPRCFVEDGPVQAETLAQVETGHAFAALAHLVLPDYPDYFQAPGPARDAPGRELLAAVTQAGELRVFELGSLEQVRCTALSGQPLACLARAPGAGGALLAGGYDGLVHVFDVPTSRELGAWAPGGRRGHLAGGDGRPRRGRGRRQRQPRGVGLGTAAVGRAPARGRCRRPRQPAAQVFEGLAGEGVWCLAAAHEQLLAGSELGTVAAWDARAGPAPTWRASLGPDAVSSLAWVDDRHVVAAATDGRLRVLDTRLGGSVLAAVALGAPVTGLGAATPRAQWPATPTAACGPGAAAAGPTWRSLFCSD